MVTKADISALFVLEMSKPTNPGDNGLVHVFCE